MDLQQLINMLHDDSPLKRVAALRVLAMLEETRAINAIVVVYKNDPDERVREIAKWAGGIIWRAQERGYSTQNAIAAHFQKTPQDKKRDMEDVLAHSVLTHGLDLEQTVALQNQLDLARVKSDQLDQLRGDPHQYDTQLMNTLSRQITQDDLDMLDAGLNHES